MQLGIILSGARTLPAVTRPVKFKVAAQNEKVQPTSVEVDAVLAFVDEERRASLNVEAAEYLAQKFKGKFVPMNEQRNEEAVRLLSVALCDKSDPAKPLCASGADELRPVLVFAVAQWLISEYEDFIKAEYLVAPTAAEVDGMKADAAGK